MRLHPLLPALMVLLVPVFGCTNNSMNGDPLAPTELEMRQAAGQIQCQTVESANHLLIDETNESAALEFAGLDPTQSYRIAISGAAATSDSGLNRDKFLSVAVWYVAEGTKGRMRIADIGTTITVARPQGPIRIALIDPSGGPINDNVGSLTLAMTLLGSPVETKTLIASEHCVGVDKALAITGLDPNKGRYIIRGSQDALPARYGFPLSVYEGAYVAFQAGAGLSLATADLATGTGKLIKLRTGTTQAFAFFMEPSGGVAADNFGSAQVCLEKLNTVDERWGALAKENHFNIAASPETSVFIQCNPKTTTTIKWTGGQPVAAPGINIQQVLLDKVNVDLEQFVSQEMLTLAKGATITIPPTEGKYFLYATLLDQETLADNTGTATLLVRDGLGRNEAITLRSAEHCTLVSSPEIGAVGMPNYSVQPLIRNVFSWASGEASWLQPDVPRETVPYDRAFLFTTNAAGRQVLPIPFAAGSSVSVTPTTREGYLFFASSSAVDFREGGVTIRHKF